MKTIELNLKMMLVEQSELTLEDNELVEKAKKATEASYAPFSKFRVGAALRLKNGVVVTGCNQENSVTPLTLCAERVTIFSSQAQYPDTPILTLAIAARNINGEFVNDPISPCGSCRQVILEHEVRYNQPIRILLYGKKGVLIADSIKTLLPFSFSVDSLTD